MFGPASGPDATFLEVPETAREIGLTPGEVDWQAAFSLPSIDLQTLMGAPTVSDQPAMPFTWSFNGLNG